MRLFFFLSPSKSIGIIEKIIVQRLNYVKGKILSFWYAFRELQYTTNRINQK
jgi:chromosome condensin MukBEF MukE localization factor